MYTVSWRGTGDVNHIHTSTKIICMDRFVSFRFLKALNLCVVTAAVGCSDGGDTSTRQLLEGDRISVVNGQQFDEVFIVVDSLVLEESEAVVTVFPTVSLDPRGGFIVADSREDQVRVYSRQGELEQVYGAGTTRASSIDRPQRAKRLPNGDILVVNLVGPLTLIPDDPGQTPTSIPSTLRTARDLQVLNEREVLVVGTDSAPPSATLFILDVPGRQYLRNFFPPPSHLDKGITTTFSSVRTAHRGDRLAVVHMLSDTLVFLDHYGVELSKVRIPIDPFVAPIGPPSQAETMAGPREWLRQFTHVQDVFWIEDDQLIVQWQKLTDLGIDRGIVQMDTTGSRVWAIAPAPRLVAVRGDEFFFLDPEAEAPNRWLVAKRRLR